MVRVDGEIQDLRTIRNPDIYTQGAHEFHEVTIIENNDIDFTKDLETIVYAVIGCLQTPQGYIDGVTLENYGSKLLSLRGVPVNYHIKELAKLYIRETIPQFQGKVLDFPSIIINLPNPETSKRHSMHITLTINTIYGQATTQFLL